MRYPSMWRTRTKAAREYYRAVEREQREREAQRMNSVERMKHLMDRALILQRIEGEKAFETGRLRSENPYPDDDGKHVAWDAGWRDAYQRNS